VTWLPDIVQYRTGYLAYDSTEQYSTLDAWTKGNNAQDRSREFAK